MLKKFIGIYKYHDGELYMIKGYYKDRFEAYKDMFKAYGKDAELIVLSEQELEDLCRCASDNGVPTYTHTKIFEGEFEWLNIT